MEEGAVDLYYFKGFLNPNATPSVEEAEAKDPEIGSCTTQTEVQEAVQKLLSAKAVRVDEICADDLKSLDVWLP